MSQPKAVSLQQEVMERFLAAIEDDPDVSAPTVAAVRDAIENDDLDRQALVSRITDDLTNATPS